MKQFGLLLLVLFVAVLRAASPADEAARQCRTVHLTHEGLSYPATIMTVEITPEEVYSGTYFCVMGFNGGFCGIQELYDGKHIVLFSIWDPGAPFNFSAHPDEDPKAPRTKILYGGENVELSRFGEGTGGKSMLPLDWECGKPVRLAVSCMPKGDHRTAYTCWLWRPDRKEWFRIATFSTLASGHNARFTSCYSYIEDFLRNGESRTHVRRANFSRAWGYNGTKWNIADRALFSADRNASTAIDAGAEGCGYWLQTGGDTVNSTTALWSKITPTETPEQPECLDILLQAIANEVE